MLTLPNQIFGQEFGCVVRDKNGDRLCGKNTAVYEKLGAKLRL
jgi:hypothetical protein